MRSALIAVRRSPDVAAAISDNLADRSGLASSIRSALDDPAVRAEIRDALESQGMRTLVWKVAEDEFRGRRLTLIREATSPTVIGSPPGTAPPRLRVEDRPDRVVAMS
ncbi:hypothetical protein ABGB07_23290 [Micromonosporaceae bacterium B7E4]